MRNVNILTIHKEPNYGAVMQAYALYHTVEMLGYTPRIINLSMDYRCYPYNLKYKIALHVYRYLKGYSHCFRIAENFNKRYCPNQIGNFHTMQELEAYPWNKNDCYLIGSDQVWNPEITRNLSNAFCFSFLDNHITNKYAYAASFGNIKDEEDRKKNLDMASLASFKRIAVRERFGVDFLNHCGIQAQEVVDPTLLLDDYTPLLPRKAAKNDELLFLSLSDTVAINKFATDLSAKLGLPVKKVYGYLQPRRSANLKFLPVEEWLHAIASSQIVLTDSFHATVFAILFKRPFFVYISEPSKIFRISNLLDRLNIKGRIVDSIDAATAAPLIDYAEVYENLAAYRKHSLDYLKTILNESSNL